MPRNTTFAAPRKKALAAAVLMTLAAAAASAQEAAVEGKWVPPGLPSGIDWTFNFDATLGAFSFGNSLYTEPKPDDISGDLTANWWEGSIKPALSAEYTTSSSAVFYGAASAVGEQTYGASPDLVGGDASSFDAEDLYIGWRSGNSLDLGEDVLDFTVGRARYRLGNGLILWDGASEGGSRGGFWTNARQAFEMAAIGRFKPGKHTAEVFYLDKDELPESDSRTEITGLNYEYAIGEDSTLGATYLSLDAERTINPSRDGLDVYDVRAYVAPFPNKNLSFEAEYVLEDNGLLRDSEAYNLLGAYQFENGWMPKVSYRYAFFEGNDPTTLANESFDGLLTGFSDWGSWWQGEIAGEYFVSNSNLISHQLRVHVTPRESISTGLILYDFKLDKTATPTGSDDVATELDWYMDWSVNDNFTASFVLAWADPGTAVQQSSGRTDSFVYGMIYGAYHF